MNRLTISTECPNCGGPLDFTEGTNALQCSHCKTNLLVTGRGQVLSYAIAPKMKRQQAEGRAAAAHIGLGRRGLTLVRSELYYIPYYRLTGQLFGWTGGVPRASTPEKGRAHSNVQAAPLPEPERREPETVPEKIGEWLGDLMAMAVDSLTDASPPGQKRGPVPIPVLPQSAPAPSQGPELVHRYIEKNFIGRDLGISELYSIGVRPAVLRLHLFDSTRIGKSGIVLAPSIPAAAALERGLSGSISDGEEELASSTVVSSVLSLIYFPFWVLEFGEEGETLYTLIDAVSEQIVRLEADSSLTQKLEQTSEVAPATAGFRPLVCPNCGWDMRFQQDEVVFVCSSCRRAWQIEGTSLESVSSEIVRIPGKPVPKDAHFLPFWVIRRGEDEAAGGHYLIPAFRYRNLKALIDLARKLSRPGIDLESAGDLTPELGGCYYDNRDASKLARFTRATLRTRRSESQSDEEWSSSVAEGSLAWLPFSVRGSLLIEPVTGMNLFRNLLEA